MAGGIVAVPLLGFSLLAVALIIERAYFWSQIQLRQNRLVNDVLKLYRSNPPGAIAKLKQNADLPMARIFLEALCLEGATPTEFRLALESATQAELPLLNDLTPISDHYHRFPSPGLTGDNFGTNAFLFFHEFRQYHRRQCLGGHRGDQ